MQLLFCLFLAFKLADSVLSVPVVRALDKQLILFDFFLVSHHVLFLSDGPSCIVWSALILSPVRLGPENRLILTLSCLLIYLCQFAFEFRMRAIFGLNGMSLAKIFHI